MSIEPETCDERQRPGHDASRCVVCLIRQRWEADQAERRRLTTLGVPVDRIAR